MVRGEGDKTSRAGDEEGEGDGEADPSLRLPSRVLLANQRQHSESFLSLALGVSFLSLSESQNKTQSVFAPVDIMRIFPQESQLHKARFCLCLICFFVALLQRANKSLPKCYIDGKIPGRDASMSAKNAMDAHLRRRLALKQKKMSSNVKKK